MRHKHNVDVAFDVNDSSYVAHFLVSGGYTPDTFEAPGECPEAELCCIQRDSTVRLGVVADSDYTALGITDRVLDGLTDRALDHFDSEEPDQICRCGERCVC